MAVTDPSPEAVAALAEALVEAARQDSGFAGVPWDERFAPRILSHPFTPAQRAAIVATLLPVEELAAAIASVKYEADPEDADLRFARRVLAALRERGA